MDLAANLKLYRERNGLSQRTLAVKAAVSQAYISGLEAGKKQPTIPIVRKLAAALGVTVSELLGENDFDHEYSAELCPTGTD